MKMSSLKKEKFIVLIKDNADENNIFFMHNCWNKIGDLREA